MDTIDLAKNIHQKGELDKSKNVKLLTKLKKLKSEQSDKIMHQAHDEVFEETDCLTCANCCKTTSPAIYERDIDRISKRLKMKPSQFIEKYLNKDDDHYVLKYSPCVFLDEANYCSIYEDRPMACKTYPHTDRKRVVQINNLTLENTLICPAVQKILMKVELHLSK